MIKKRKFHLNLVRFYMHYQPLAAMFVLGVSPRANFCTHRKRTKAWGRAVPVSPTTLMAWRGMPLPSLTRGAAGYRLAGA